ncbi:MAG TPA: glutamate cyclase domain-containing protein [Chloroflexia bacterium]|nr:glutamate cyclase domain-containing protein [Chloroflexia bacterium]
MTLPTGATHHPIEQILLARGWRGMDRLARHLPLDYCAQAARAAWDARPRALLTTGFYVSGHPETDGPPGTFFLARGLAHGGATVGFVAEEETLALLRALAAALWPAHLPAPQYLPFPIADSDASRAFSADLCAAWQPSLVLAVERCGRNAEGRYLNRRLGDITPYTAQVDELLDAPGAVTIGVGDGGNEIGMGRLADVLQAELEMATPAVTPADYLVAATVSNWGAYGLLAYLSAHAQQDLLPTNAEAAAALRMLADHGAVNGMSGRAEAIVDGFPPEVEAAVLDELRAARADLTS